MHGFGHLQIPAEILNCLILSGGEAEAEQPSDAGINFGCDGQRDGFLSASPSASQRQSELEFQQIIQQDATSGDLPLFGRGGDVQSAEGFRQGWDSELFAE